jgi:copper oxidase (laccase) domain-containing protein
VGGIIQNAVSSLEKNYGSQSSDIEASLGPCAHACCYEVSGAFVDDLEKECCVEIERKWFFDLPLYIQKQLVMAGILKENIDISRCSCTICNPQFCSYRRDGDRSCRQLTVALLRRSISL